MKNIVTAEWLMENMNRNDIVILDCRFSLNDPHYGEKAYKEAHIKNAIYVDLEKDLTGDRKRHGGRHPLPDIGRFVNRIEEFGIGDESIVVIYDECDMPGAARLWWMLKYIGKDGAYVLDGGINEWKSKGGETTAEASPVPVRGKFNAKIQSKMICDIEFVKDNIGSENSVIVDSRANERYKGIVEPIDKRGGHIPGAVNYFWQEVLGNNKIRDIDALKARFEKLKEYDKLIVHCGSGITACPNILAMDEIGLKPILYLGGWSDWVSYDESEVIKEE
jgi:thiosulfate/3-mercaptopyruvate sulfurtransferase